MPRQSSVALVAPGVHRLRLGRGLTEVNVYLVESETSWVLVDTGWTHQAGAVHETARALFGAQAPVAILLTHVHPDHSGAAPTLVREWGVPVYAHPTEVPFARGGYDPEYAHPLDRWVVGPLLRLIPAERVEQARQRASLEDVTIGYDPQAPLPHLPEWRCVPSPGHTPGHAAYYRDDDGVLLCGDAVLTVDTNNPLNLLTRRWGLYLPPRISSWDWAQSKASLRRLAALDPRVVASGHGPVLVPTSRVSA
jgi:glyoxylase-like metal-dependent hydrolase (beta-lactamase superfamily II)